MKIKRGTIYQMKIPFVEAFAHGSQARAFSDAIIVRLETGDGVIGFGEGLARRYVTGEMAETSVDYIKRQIFPSIQRCHSGRHSRENRQARQTLSAFRYQPTED